MFYLKINENKFDYKRIFVNSKISSSENYKYIDIIKNFNNEIKNNKIPTIFNYIKNKTLKVNSEYINLLTMLMIIEKEGGMEKIKEKADIYFEKIKKKDKNTYDDQISYNCSLLTFYNSIYNLNLELFIYARIAMLDINSYFSDNFNNFIHEDNEGEIFTFLDMIYGYDEDKNNLF